jgi:hypothetical protein
MMIQHELTKTARGVALSHGADLASVVKVSDLPEHTESILRILPTAHSIMVVGMTANGGCIAISC